MQERFKAIIEKRKLENPQFDFDALNVFMGKQIIDAITATDIFFTADGSGIKQVEAVRERLKAQGMVLPAVRLRDLDIDSREFIITFGEKVVFDGEFSEEQEISSEHMIEKLEEVVKNRYSELKG